MRNKLSVCSVVFILFLAIGCSEEAEKKGIEIEAKAEEKLDQQKNTIHTVMQAKENASITANENQIEQESCRNSEANQLENEQLKQAFSTIDLSLPYHVSEPRKKAITHIMIHFTSNAGIDPEQPYDVQAIRQTFIDYEVSAHYLVGRNGEVYELVPEDRVAYHAGKGNLQLFPKYKDKLNHYSIGIEVMAIGTKEEMKSMIAPNVYDSIAQSHIGYTEAQYQSLNHLIDHIVEKNPLIKRNRYHIVGHDEYAPGRKTDPGSLFDWSKIGFRDFDC